VTTGGCPAFTIKQARDRHEELRALVERGDSLAKSKQAAVAERKLSDERRVTFRARYGGGIQPHRAGGGAETGVAVLGGSRRGAGSRRERDSVACGLAALRAMPFDGPVRFVTTGLRQRCAFDGRSIIRRESYQCR
jgi:hypothetical protein